MNPYIGMMAVIGAYGYGSGKLKCDIIDIFKNKRIVVSPTAPTIAHNPIPAPIQHITIVSKPNYYTLLVPITCALAMGVAYLYILKKNKRIIIDKVEDTADETQDLVTKCDDNNAERFNILDQKNDDRAEILESQVISEQRAEFEIITKQICGLTDICAKTLSALCNFNNDDFSKENLSGYINKMQTMTDTILSDENLLKRKQHNLQDIKVEINKRNKRNSLPNISSKKSLDEDNIFQINHRNGKTRKNISYKQYLPKKQVTKNTIANNSYLSSISMLINAVKPFVF